VSDELLLVGSVPLETSVDVFEACSRTVARLLPAVPDGETNDRIWWVNMLCYRVFQHHPDLVTLNRPPKDANGYPRWKPANVDEMWHFKVAPGVSQVRFADLIYASDAIASYKVFRLLRDAGRFPRDLRFMVCLPMLASGIDLFFRDPADRPIIYAAFADAIDREIDRMLEVIPPEDLLIQWDACVEVLDIEGFFPWSVPNTAFQRNTEPFGRLSAKLPSAVQLGYHLCYGTLGGWPMLKPKDLGVCVRMANEAMARSGRRVDYVHMPVPRHVTADYFRPLENLDPTATRVYLGLIHDTDDLDANLARVRAAKPFIDSFGLSSVCGLGRLEPQRVEPSLRLQASVVEASARLRKAA
jgi:hypothetical protein